MELFWEPISVLNIVLCLIIIYLGIWSYSKNKSKITLYITAAFTLFAASHLAVVLGFKEQLENVIILIRIAAYLTVAFALHNTAYEKEARLR